MCCRWKESEGGCSYRVGMADIEVAVGRHGRSLTARTVRVGGRDFDQAAQAVVVVPGDFAQGIGLGELLAPGIVGFKASRKMQATQL